MIQQQTKKTSLYAESPCRSICLKQKKNSHTLTHAPGRFGPSLALICTASLLQEIRDTRTKATNVWIMRKILPQVKTTSNKKSEWCFRLTILGRWIWQGEPCTFQDISHATSVRTCQQWRHHWKWWRCLRDSCSSAGSHAIRVAYTS